MGMIVKELPVRKPKRLIGYDYSQAGCYFITICAKDREETLGKIVGGKSELNEYGSIVKQEIEAIPEIRRECLIDKYVIMPNHIHLIVRLVGDDGNRPAGGNRSGNPQTNGEKRADCHPPLRRSVPNMVQGFKGAVTRRLGFSLWQTSYHDHIIRDDEDYLRIWKYIDENPCKWQDDQYYNTAGNSSAKS